MNLTDRVSDNLGLSGKTFLITGATQGLGEAVALLYAERGARRIAIVGRHQTRGASVVKKLAHKGCEGLFIQADLTDVSDCLKLVEKVETVWGDIHGVVCCAGATDRGSILDTDPATYQKLFAVNAQAPFFIIQKAAKRMVENQIEGTFVIIGSISSHGGQSFLTPYVGSKAAIVAMTKNIAFSLMRNRIRANVLNIGWMDSPGEHEVQRTYHHAEPDWLQRVESKEPFGRLIKPDEVARAAAFLSSSESGLMTGAVIDFDQGVIGCGDGRSPQPDNAM